MKHYYGINMILVYICHVNINNNTAQDKERLQMEGWFKDQDEFFRKRNRKNRQ